MKKQIIAVVAYANLFLCLFMFYIVTSIMLGVLGERGVNYPETLMGEILLYGSLYFFLCLVPLCIGIILIKRFKV